MVSTLVVVGDVVRPEAAEALEAEVQVSRLSSTPWGRPDVLSRAVSADGRFVAFTAWPRQFDSSSTNETENAWLLDRDSGEVELVSETPQGDALGGATFAGAGVGELDVSDDGRFVVYETSILGTVALDPSEVADAAPGATWILLRDREAGTTRVVSRLDAGGDDSVVAGFTPRIAGDGSVILFGSGAALVPEDDNSAEDLYLHDVATGTETLVSRRLDGAAAGLAQGALGSLPWAVSDDGSTVAFTSEGTGIVSPEPGGVEQLYVYDVASGGVALASIAADGTTATDGTVRAPVLNADGTRVAFHERGPPAVPYGTEPSAIDPTGTVGEDILVKDLVTGEVLAATIPPAGASEDLSVIPSDRNDGLQQYAFDPSGTRLALVASGAGTTGFELFVRDLAAATTVAVHQPEPSSGAWGVAWTTGGELVYEHGATDLATPDTGTRRTPMASTLDPDGVATATERLLYARTASDGRSYGSAASPDGRFVAFISDATNLVALPAGAEGRRHVYVLDRTTGEYDLVSTGPDGGPATEGTAHGGGLDISADGRFVAFSYSADLDPDPDTTVDGDMVHVHDRVSGETFLVSRNADGGHIQGTEPSLSDDGTLLSYRTYRQVSPDDDNGRTDVVLRDLVAGTQTVVSAAPDGSPGDDDVGSGAISGDGSTVVFSSEATNLVAPLTTGRRHVFAHDVASGTTVLVSATADGARLDVRSDNPQVSKDGRTVVFVRRPNMFDPSVSDIVVKDRDTGALTVVSTAPEADVGHDGVGFRPTISADGTRVAFTASGAGSWDTGRNRHAFLHDLPSGTTLDVSPDPDYPVSFHPGYDAGFVGIIGDGSGVLFTDDQLYVGELIDSVAPTFPIGATLDVLDVGQTVATVGWTAASDDDRVATYRLLVDGAEALQVDGSTLTMALDGLVPDTTYALQVVAVDAAGNETAGPTTELTTAGAGEQAVFVAEPRPGGIVELSWDAAATADAYRVLRDLGDGFVQVAEVDGTTTVTVDDGLPAATDVTYRVDVVVGADQSEHTQPVTVTTPALRLDDVTWVGQRNRAQRLLLGSTVDITATGEPNRTATAVVTVSSWFGDGGTELDEPAPRELEVPLTEGDPGTYTGVLPIAEGTAELTSVGAVLSDGAGAAAIADAGRPAAGVTGTLLVTLLSDDPVDDGRVTVVSPTAYGAQGAVVPGSDVVEVTDLTPADDYEVRLLAPDGQARSTPFDVATQPGRTLPVDLTVELPASLEVRLTSPDGVPSGTVTVTEIASGAVVGETAVGPDGGAGPFTGLRTGRDIQVDFTPNGASLHASVGLTPDPLRLRAGGNVVNGDIPLPPFGTLRGTVTDGRGSPAAGGTIEYVYRYLGREFVARATVAADGTWSLQAPTSEGHLITSVAAARPLTQDIAVVAGEERVLDIVVPPAREVEILVDLTTQLPGGAPTSVEMDGRQVFHYSVLTPELGGGGGYPLVRTVEAGVTDVLVCADGGKVGLPRACDRAVIGPDDVAVADIQLTWQGSVAASLRTPDGTPLDAGSTWTAVVRRPLPDGFEILSRFQGTGPEMRLPVAEPTTVSVDVVTEAGSAVLQATTSSSASVVDVGDLQLVAPSGVAAAAGTEVALLDVRRGPDGLVDVRVELASASGEVAGTLRLDVPAGVVRDLDAVTVDGVPVSPQLEPLEPRALRVPLTVDADGTVVRLQLPVPVALVGELIGVRAFFEPSTGGSLFLGRDTQREEPLTLEVPSTVRSRDVALGGVGSPGATLQVRDDHEQLLATVVVSADGTWSADATLVDRGPWYRHRLTAEIVAGAAPFVTREVAVDIDPTLPVLTGAVMEQADGRRIEIPVETGLPARFPYVFAASYPLAFELTFDNPEQVRDGVVVVGNAPAPLRLRDDGVHVAEVEPGRDDLGDIRFDWGSAVGAAVLQRPAPTPQEVASRFPAIEGAVVDSLTVDGVAVPVPTAGTSMAGRMAVTLVRGLFVQETTSSSTARLEGRHVQAGGGGAQVAITVEELDEYVFTAQDVANEEATGYPVYGASFRVGTVTETSASSSLEFVVPREAASTVAVGGALGAALHDGGLRTGRVLRDDGVVVGEAGSRLMFANAAVGQAGRELVKVSVNAFAWWKDYDGGLANIDRGRKIGELARRAQECAGAAGPGLRGLTNRLENRYAAAFATNLGLGLAGGLAATGVGALPAAGLALATVLVGDIIDAGTDEMMVGVEEAIEQAYALDQCEEEEEEEDDEQDDEQRDGDDSLEDWNPSTVGGRWGKCILLAQTEAEMDACGERPPPWAQPIWIHDPSGYVYEGVASNRLEGVTATILRAPSPDGPWQVWDAAWYGQLNPHPTDVEGRYGWDVPEDWWKVRWEKDGYLTQESEPLEVLPPRFNVNAGLVDPTPPTVTGVRVTPDGNGITVEFDRYMLAADLTATALLLEDAAGGDVPITVALPDAEDDPDGRTLTTSAVVVPTDGLTLGATYIVDVGALVRSYAGTPMGGDVRTEVTVAENGVPVATGDRYVVVEDTTFGTTAPGVLADDVDPDGHALTAQLVEAPTAGELDLRADGSFTYRPAPDSTAPTSFTYVATDGVATSDPVVVDLVVQAVDDAPVAAGDAYEVVGSLSVSGTGVLVNDSDPDGDALSAAVVAGPQQGTLAFSGDGSFIYEPTPGYEGIDAFVYRVWDGMSWSSAVVASLTVTREDTDGSGGDAGGGQGDAVGDEPAPDPSSNPAPGGEDEPDPDVDAEDEEADGDTPVAGTGLPAVMLPIALLLVLLGLVLVVVSRRRRTVG